MGVAPKYRRDAIRLPTSASFLRPLRSLDMRELFVPRSSRTMAKSRSFSVAGPSFWNRLPPSARASFLSSNLSASLPRQQKFWAMNGAHLASPIRGERGYAQRAHVHWPSGVAKDLGMSLYDVIKQAQLTR